MSRLEEKIEGQNGNEDDDVPISRMMSANEYQTNQLALQKKAGLAKHNAWNSNFFLDYSDSLCWNMYAIEDTASSGPQPRVPAHPG